MTVPGYYAGRVAVITGAGSGLGRALALELAGRGAVLALSDRDGDAARATARQCERAGLAVRADVVDITDRDAVVGYARDTAGEFGRVDAVFCVAGIIHAGSVLTTDWADIDAVINVNLRGTVNSAKAFLPHVRRGGHVVTFSSGLGVVSAPRFSIYGATKFAIRGFSGALRQEMAGRVWVTCVVPGGIRTPIMRNGLFAEDEDQRAVIANFEKSVARMNARKAASVIVRGVQQRKAELMVGMDAHAVSMVARATGGGYLRAVPWLARLAGSRRPDR